MPRRPAAVTISMTLHCDDGTKIRTYYELSKGLCLAHVFIRRDRKNSICPESTVTDVFTALRSAASKFLKAKRL